MSALPFHIASETVLLPGVEFRYITNDRTGETANLFESLICYGFIWFLFNTSIWICFIIAISIAGAILGQCGYKQEVDKLLDGGMLLNRLVIAGTASTLVTGSALLLYMFNIISVA